MVKYHINSKGVPAICKAKLGNCPLGDDNKHFNTTEGAQAYANKENEEKYELLPEVNNVAKSDERTQLLTKKDELINSMENLKGLSKIRAKRELERIEYTLEGKDYDEVLRLREEERQAVIEEQSKKELESKSNAEMLAEKETLELPKSIEQYVVSGSWSRVKVSAFRGEQEENLKAQTNTGLAMYGQGRYTTTDKSYAKKFGTVREAELDELPVHPLRLKTIGGFQLLEQEVARNHNINYRDLYTKMDVSDMVKKMGYDGLTLGTGKDMIIVKYSD